MRSSHPTLLASVLLACGLGCSPRVQTGALKVEVVYDSNVVSKCVKVVATDDVGSTPLETMPISLVNQTSPLLVGVGGSSPLAQPFRVQALGYSDVGCTTRSNEESTAEPGVFAVPPQTVTLVLKVQPQNDGGTGGGDGGASDAGAGDGGTPDAGSDAGAVDAGAVDAGAVDAGGVDAGAVDAGLDLDLDGVPQPADCNDNNPQIRPGIPEVCDNNNVDDDCNGMADCAETSCTGAPCTNSGTCMSGMCMTPIEVCNDRVDNNSNGLTDCEESTCATQACNDANACTLNETCNGPDAGPDGGCTGAAVQCSTPPVCFMVTGVCQADGGTCAYTPLNSGACDDRRACTDTDSCASGMCTGTPRVCTTNNACLTGGACVEDAGTCSFTPVASGTGTCTDGDECTTNDACDGDGGCAGTRVNCAEPSQCHRWATTCQSDGACNFLPRTTCDAGTATPGSCNSSFVCVPPVTNIFPYTPSTFTEAQLPANAGTPFGVSCATTLNTTTPAITTGACVTMPPFAIITPANGQETLLLKVSSLLINSGQTLTITGTRPVIFAVLGETTIDGTILARAGQAPASLCGNGGNGTGKEGGGGGGFGGVGRAGGGSDTGTFGAGGTVSGAEPINPLRGGCRGGNGGPGGGNAPAGGEGGGAVQISATGLITIAGTIAAPGREGAGGVSQDSAGGGGGSGGAILVEGAAITTTSSASMTANGGGGGGGDNNGTDGVAGNPGSQTTANPASGGNGPGTAGSGGAGGAGSTNAVVGENSGDDGAGGGGGGVGRIRLRGTTCTIDSATLFSPPRGVGGNGC